MTRFPAAARAWRAGPALVGALALLGPPPAPAAVPPPAPPAAEGVLELPTVDLGKPRAVPPAQDPLFSGMSELSAEVLVQQVLARNPTLAQMTAAWQAARARYPQVTSLEDPMFEATVGPGTIKPDD